jgi:hypothetical protein
MEATESGGMQMAKRIDLTGQRFGRLVCIEPAEPKIILHYIPGGGVKQKRFLRWLCRCDCGELHIAYANQLTAGTVRSCGCLRRELATERLREIGKRNRKEGRDVKTEATP